MTELPPNLIDGLREGNEDAYRQLYELYGDQIYILAFGILQNGADAEDVVQKTFFHVYRKLSTLKNDKSFPKWLMKIATNEALMTLRYRKPVESYSDAPEDVASDTLQDDTMLPEIAAERSIEAEKLRAIIARLPEAQRRTLTLYYYHGMKISEIAEMMECSEGTVKSRLRYARIRVKDEWEKQEGERKHYGVMLPFGDVFVRLLKKSEPKKRPRAALWKRIRADLRVIDDPAALLDGGAKAAVPKMGAFVAVGVAVVLMASATMVGAAEDTGEPTGGYSGGRVQQSRTAETQPEQTVYYSDEDIVEDRIGEGAGNYGDTIYRYTQDEPVIQRQELQETPGDTEETQPTEPPTEAPTESPTEPPAEQPTELPTEAPTEAPTQTPLEKMLSGMSGSYKNVNESFPQDVSVNGGGMTIVDYDKEVTFESLRFNSAEQIAEGVYRFDLEQQERYDGMFNLWNGNYYQKGTSVSYLPQELREMFHSLGYWRYEIRYSVDDYRMQKDVLLLIDPQNENNYEYYYRAE